MAGVDVLAEAFSGANAAFLSEQYARWAVNPAAVDPSFADLFDAMDDEARAVLADVAGASWAPHATAAPRPSGRPSGRPLGHRRTSRFGPPPLPRYGH